MIPRHDGSDHRDDGPSETFILYRILGNDLPPRHERGQTLTNLQFIIANEPALPGVEKRWLLNHIVDAQVEGEIIELIERHGQSYMRLPFDEQEYRSVRYRVEGFPEPDFLYGASFERLKAGTRRRAEDTAYHDKNRYLMNNNGARNAALRAGRGEARWVMPWDGNCYLTREGWNEIRDSVSRQSHLPYHVVPMTRVLNNAALLAPDFAPEPVEEPQLIFRCDAREEFDEDQRYGRRPKVELFWRLGIPGPWDEWGWDPWEQHPRPSRDFGCFGQAGWVARLFSGVEELEHHTAEARNRRGIARQTGVRLFIDTLDEKLVRQRFSHDNLIFVDEAKLDEQLSGSCNHSTGLVRSLEAHAATCLTRGPYSVAWKTTLPPSGDMHDYWHPAPYWWPDPDSPDGLPYVRRDGHRVPGTELNGSGSEQYDRTSLQAMFDDVFVTALAWRCTGKTRFATHAAGLIRTWFIDPATRMNPHMRYAQVQMGRNDNEGSGFGIIEFKDIHYVLDAVRLLERSGEMHRADRDAFRDWLREYLVWLRESRQGARIHRSSNNQGTYFDLQIISIAAYLDDIDIALNSLMYSQQRILQQFSPEGSQPFEMDRVDVGHYCLFNLQGWFNLATIAQACDVDLWSYETSDGRSLHRAYEWLNRGMTNDELGGPEIDRTRLIPLHLQAAGGLETKPPPVSDISSTDPIPSPYSGVRPYWYLGYKADRGRGAKR